MPLLPLLDPTIQLAVVRDVQRKEETVGHLDGISPVSLVVVRFLG